ncbi:MAG: putative lipid II flippase FtsW [Vampirovibrio sp.]|nr:putative lipid II flippase FtsW [Vampirovibrio sp.]
MSSVSDTNILSIPAKRRSRVDSAVEGEVLVRQVKNQPTTQTKARLDQQLVIMTVFLVLFGWVAVYSASAHQAAYETGNSVAIVLKQIVFTLIGFGGMWAASKFHYKNWAKLSLPFAAVAIGLLFLTLATGKIVNGSERWLTLPGGIQFQPSEIAKLSAIVLLAQAVSQRRLFSGTLFFNLALVGGMIMLIYSQPNLSVSMILGILTLVMLFVGGLPTWIFGVTLPVMGMVLFQKIQNTPYQWRRITGWLDPWADPQDSGYNLIQSYYAIGSGGIFGSGLGNSIQKLFYLPFQHTDFIFAVICEELGLIGAVILIGLFLSVAYRGFKISMRSDSDFGRMLAFGITSALLLQAFINICVTIGLMPVTGITLPLISYGGTSVVVTLTMIGVLLNVSRYRRKVPA